MLSNGYKGWLMIGGRIYRRLLVDTIRQTSCNPDGKNSIFVLYCVNTLEKGKFGRVRWGR